MQLDGLGAAPWCAPVDHLGLVETVDGFAESIVVAISNQMAEYIQWLASKGERSCFGGEQGRRIRGNPASNRALNSLFMKFKRRLALVSRRKLYDATSPTSVGSGTSRLDVESAFCGGAQP